MGGTGRPAHPNPQDTGRGRDLQSIANVLINLNLPGAPEAPAIEVDFDLVELNVSPVPEPSTWAFLLAGLGVIFATRKLRR